VHAAHLLSWGYEESLNCGDPRLATPASATLHNADVIRHAPQDLLEFGEKAVPTRGDVFCGE